MAKKTLILSLLVVSLLFSALPAAAEDAFVLQTGELAINSWHLHYSRHEFSVSDPGFAILRVTKATPDKAIEGGFLFLNLRAIPLKHFFRGQDLSFEKKVKLRSLNHLNVFLYGTPSAAITIDIRMENEPYPPPTITFTADPTTITLGDAATLNWQTENSESVSIDNNIGTVNLSGATQVIPTETTTYTLTATGPGGTATAQVLVTVTHLPPVVLFTANPDTIVTGESAVLSWSTDFAKSCVIEPDIGIVELNGSLTVTPTETTVYKLIATGDGGESSAEVTVTVTDPPPVVEIQSSAQTIIIGQSATLTWTSQYATACTIEPGIGTMDPNGSLEVAPTETTTYTITATGSGGSTSAQVTIAVEHPVPSLTFSASPSTILLGQTSTLTWTSTYADTVEIDQNIGAVETSGTHQVSPTQTTTYTLTATGSGGTTTAQVTVTVTYPQPSVDLQIAPESITAGETALLSWTSSNAVSLSIDNGIGTVEASGSISVSPAATTSYTITATGVNGTIATDSVNLTVTLPAPIVSFGADPQSIAPGGSAQLTWSTTYADSVTIEPGIGSVPVNASQSVSPIQTTTYTLTATGAGGTTTKSVTVTVIQPPTVTISASATTINQGESVTLTWSATNTDTCTIAPDLGSVPVSGTAQVSPNQTITYTITATGPGGTATASTNIIVTEKTIIPTVQLEPAEITIGQGETATLNWTSTGANYAHIDNGVGSVLLSGSTVVAPEVTSIYTLTVTGPGGSASAKVLVHVTGLHDSQPEGSFGQQYEHLIPTDATEAIYDHYRFAVITGLIKGMDEAPLQDVLVSVLNHPEYGTARTDTDGRFSIPVEGGSDLTITGQKDGYISVQRKIYVPWNDIASCETFTMLSLDTAATEVRFDGDPQTVITHRGSFISDGSGTRSCTTVFSGDTHAYLIDENGSDIHQLNTIVTRATEFTAPETMPAELPPNSAFTYCAELTVDGVDRVRFDKPVVTWVENFLGFAVGTPAPVGYFDKDKGEWVPSENGLVVQLLDTDSDGIVDALDSDGDALPNDLNEDGSYRDEVRGLEDTSVYLPGSTFWRVEFRHFTPWDINWPFAADSDATPPSAGLKPYTEFKDGRLDCNARKVNSFVKDRSRVFHEDIPIAGTQLALHYASSRTRGYQATDFIIPVSGAEVPGTLKRIIAKLEVAGHVYEQTFDPLPNQFAEFKWDGTDAYGNVTDKIKAGHISVGYVYDAYYMTPSAIAGAFGQPGTELTMVPAREEAILWQYNTVSLNLSYGTLADGWTISNHHYINPVDTSVLHKGDGTDNQNQINTIQTVFNNPSSRIGGIAVDSEGILYIAMDHCIFKNGTLYAGKQYDPGHIDGVAGQAEFGDLQQLTIDSNGVLYVTDYWNYGTQPSFLRRIDKNQNVTTIAGGGTLSGEYIPAISASLESLIFGISNTDNQGNVYFQSWHGLPRKLDTNGYLSVVNLSDYTTFPYRMGCVDNNGNIYFSLHDNQIGRLEANSGFRLIAGTGVSGYSGDGGPALNCQLNYIYDMEADNRGNIYIADQSGAALRKIDSDGIITTIAGTGATGYTGDGGPAAKAQINARRIAIDPEGAIYIADYSNIRKITIPSGFKDKADLDDIIFSDPNGHAYIMSVTGKHIQTIDLNSDVVLNEFEYNQDNKLTAIIDQFGNRISIELDVTGTASTIISPEGIRTALTIDANHHLKQITYPDGSQYDFEYSGDGLMTVETDPNNNQFNHTFGDGGLITDVQDQEFGHWLFNRQVFPEGYIETTVTTAEGNVTSYKDSILATESYAYTVTKPDGDEIAISKSNDNLSLNETMPCGMSVDRYYDLDPQYQYQFTKGITETTPSGLVRQIDRTKSYQDTDSDSKVDLIRETLTVNTKTASMTQNTLSAQKVAISPEGRSVTIAYDPATLLTTELIVPGIQSVSLGYDTKGRLISVSQGTREQSLSYDYRGYLQNLTLAGQYTYTYEHDVFGRITAIHRPDGSSVGFDYDANGNMRLLTTPATASHNFIFNAVNNLDTHQTPISGDYTYTYNRDRELIGISYPSGQQITNIYNHTQLIQIQMPHGNVDLSYLCGSRVDSMTMGAESVNWDYDGKLVVADNRSGTLNQGIGYAYNDDFSLETINYAGGTYQFSYDTDGLLTGAGQFTIARNADNGLPESVYNSSLIMSQSFNGYGEINSQTTDVSGKNILTWSLTRDNLSRITQRNETINGENHTFVYTYDAMGRLLTVTRDSTLVEEYGYDAAAGTRTLENNTLRGITGRSFSYSDEDHLLTADGVSYTYDLDGFLTTKTTASQVTSYNYSLRGELLRVDLPDGRIVEYVHDPLGRRIAKRINGTIVEKYLWQSLSTLLAVYDGADNLVQRFEYAGGRLPASMQQDGTTYYLAYDQVGSLRIVADSDGIVIKRIDYDSFGSIIADTNTSIVVPFGFGGGLHDRDIGLVRFGYRDYNPDTGRWTSKDPIGFDGGDTDLYGYVQNNPVNLIDPYGLTDDLARALTGQSYSSFMTSNLEVDFNRAEQFNKNNERRKRDTKFIADITGKEAKFWNNVSDMFGSIPAEDGLTYDIFNALSQLTFLLHAKNLEKSEQFWLQQYLGYSNIPPMVPQLEKFSIFDGLQPCE